MLPVHHQIPITRGPRLLIYSSFSLVLILQDPSSHLIWGSALAALGMPLLMHHCLGRVTKPGSVIALHSLEAFAVALILGFNHPHPATTALFTTTLLMAHCVIGGLRLLLPSAALASLGIPCGSLLGGLDVHNAGPSELAPDLALALGAQFVFGIWLSLIVYAMARRMGRRKADLRAERTRFETLSQRLVRYLAPSVSAAVESGRIQDGPGYKRSHLTVLFSDLVDFTILVDHHPAALIAEFTNDYLREMTDIVLQYGGTLDKTMGDGLLVFFGDPVSAGRAPDARRCTSMAWVMRQRLPEISARWRPALPNLDLRIRVGIHSGECLVGNFGSAEHISYTAIGAAVNLASRIESQGWQNHILVSEATRRLIASEYCTIALPVQQLRNIRAPVRLHCVVGPRNQIGGAEPCHQEQGAA